MLTLPVLAGCRNKEIRAYSTPKEDADAVVPQTEAAVEPVVAPQVAAHWQPPTDWKPLPASGLRLASFRVQGESGEIADISVVTFGGSGGDELANINRWRGQLKLEPVAAEALPSQIETFSTPAGAFSLADLAAEQAEAGKPPTRIVGAWLRRGNTVWFFKMMGPTNLVGAQKGPFKDFLASVTFSVSANAGGQGSPAAGTNDLPKPDAPAPELLNPPGGPALPSGAGLKAASGSLLRWNAPAAWTVKAPTSMRKGSYALGPGGAVDLSITAFPGDVGGPIANVNRWLDQVGLPPIEEADLPAYTTHASANGLTFFIADTGSKDPAHPQRIIAAVASWNGNSWFFKMTGSTEAVVQEKAGFLDFLQTVRAP
jgi:hypothetical protein